MINFTRMDALDQMRVKTQITCIARYKAYHTPLSIRVVDPRMTPLVKVAMSTIPPPLPIAFSN